MELFPAIDLRQGRVVRLYQGDYGREQTYGDDPVGQARAFAEAGARWLHVVDLDGARSGKITQFDVIRRLCNETDLRVQVGGGVRTEGAIDRLLSAGAERVVLGTAALRDWEWFESLMGNMTYRGRLVLGLDARDGRVAVSGWEQQTDTSAIECAERVSAWPLAAIVYTDIATDGTMAGPNAEATRQLAAATAVPVVASGGIGTLEHLRALAGLPIEGAIVGRALYEGAFTAQQAIKALTGNGR